ncbi:hypothetical protein Cgig2_022552 [Carnegiea gigantea]|uniref:Pre-rRNA-processing protein RIX1 N-terminal domain-containing protein n=1 Tax=Carnegiea gigantea TaxID=171969 RepID=A0A9Q1QJZ3_9CARY|nr:hypothetical protein Cgig2_022552 [Carnegiea gigantea]
MAAFDHVRDLYDVALKPRLLRSLLKEQIPDETCPFRNPSELASIVSIVKTHDLLSESVPDSADQKHVSSWRSERFLASYSDWFNVLLQHIQPSGVPQLVKVASCAAVSDLLTRLDTFSNLKKEGNAQAGKLVQPILKILNEDATEAVLVSIYSIFCLEVTLRTQKEVDSLALAQTFPHTVVFLMCDGNETGKHNFPPADGNDH